METSAKLFGALAIVAPMMLASCTGNKSAELAQLTKSGLDPKNFESTVRGKQTALYTLTNANGMEVCITNLGARIVSIMAEDRDGNFQDVVLGFDNVKSYANEDGKTPSDFGAAIGRYANRIGGGTFVLDGDTIKLPHNNFGHCLHGGPQGWQYQVYDVLDADSTSITLQIVGEDGEAKNPQPAEEGLTGFPGTVTAQVTYSLTNDNELVIAYSATTDKPTVINMTNHTYFNLSGDPTNAITSDSLIVFSREMTPVDSTFKTTGEIRQIEPGTAFDFLPAMGTTNMKLIGAQIDADDEQIRYGLGYDHNWVLMTPPGNIEPLDFPAAILMSPKSGIILVEKTNEPGLQVYSGNFLDGTAVGKKGIKYQKRTGICLETQKYPDTPNKPNWPSCVLRPGETYSSVTIFEFHNDAENNETK